MKHIYNLVDVEAMPSERVGNKAKNLSVLKNKDGQLVPPAYVVDSEVSQFYFSSRGEYPKGFEKEISKAISQIEKRSKLSLGDSDKPLVLSIRISENNKSEGVKNSILNIGLNEETVQGLISQHGRHKFAYSTYCRFIYDFSIRVLGIQKSSLDKQEKAILNSEKIADYKFLNEKHLQELVVLYKSVVFNESGHRFPEDPIDQLKYAIDAVYDSWESKKARTHRKYKNFKDKGCSLIIQQMVFGNLGVNSGVGVIESRNSKDGTKGVFGEFIHEAQGPDLDNSTNEIQDISVVEDRFNESYKRLDEICSGLEIVNKNAVELDFVLEDGRLWILEIDRPALSAKSSVSVAADMLRNEIITPEEALCGLDGERLDQVFYPQIDDRSNKTIVFSGKHGSVGVAQGKLYFDIKRGIESKDLNKILIVDSSSQILTHETLKHFDGYICLKGSSNGRMAKYSRATGKPCIVNCPSVQVDWNGRKLMSESGIDISEGVLITIDADAAEVIVGDVFLLEPNINSDLRYIISNADQASRIQTLLVTEKTEDIKDGKLVGLNNIGHFDAGSYFYNEEERSLFLDIILNIKASKFVDAEAELIKILKNKLNFLLNEVGDNEINIGLFNDSLNSILPNQNEISFFADHLNVSYENMFDYIESFKNENPEFGLNGGKLYKKYTRLYEIQIRSIIEAVIESRKQNFTNGSQVNVVISSINRQEEATFLKNKFKSIMSEYSDMIDTEIGFKAEVDSIAFLLNIKDLSVFFDELIINLDKITASAYKLSYADGYNNYDETYDFNPFERFAFEMMGDLISSKIRKYKEISKSSVSAMGEHVINKPTVDFLDEAGVDKIFCTKNNSLRCKILTAQAALMRFN